MSSINTHKSEYLIYLDRIEHKMRLNSNTVIPFVSPRGVPLDWCLKEFDKRGLTLTDKNKIGVQYIILKS